jgi:hypothetical protein
VQQSFFISHLAAITVDLVSSFEEESALLGVPQWPEGESG